MISLLQYSLSLRSLRSPFADPNHKPEMAIALTPFLAFLNFLPLPTLLLHLLTVPELSPLIPDHLVTDLATSLTLPTTKPPDAFLFEPTISSPSEKQRGILKGIFGALMSASEDLVKEAVKSLISRYENENGDGEVTVVESEKGLVGLAKMLNEQYPGDVGVLCVFVLNVVELKVGEAAFLGADMPHAYISGGESSFSFEVVARLEVLFGLHGVEGAGGKGPSVGVRRVQIGISLGETLIIDAGTVSPHSSPRIRRS